MTSRSLLLARFFALPLFAGLLFASTAQAREPLHPRWLLDAAIGVSAPVADSNYTTFADPTFKFSLRTGAELWLTHLIGVAPELTIDLFPVKTDDYTYRRIVGIDTPFARFRALAGARLLIAFPKDIGAFFARFGLGLDYLWGSEQGNVGPVLLRANFSSTAFTLEPGFGAQFRVTRWGVVGATLGFPVAFHDFGRADAANIRSFTAVDADFLVFFGLRL